MNLPSTCRGDRIDIDALPSKELARVFDAVDARRLDVDVVEARLQRVSRGSPFFERAGDAADP